MSELEVSFFQKNGYVVKRGYASKKTCLEMTKAVDRALDYVLGPVEFEADLNYPGSPQGRWAQGGDTPRRLLSALSRGDIFFNWAVSPKVTDFVKELIQSRDICVSQNHHNCIMTKHPRYSSQTKWHQDIRYWSFLESNLVTAWLALGEENSENGCLEVIPTSHRIKIDKNRFDSSLFLNDVSSLNEADIDPSEKLVLSQGDVVFFHCNLLHSAGINLSDRIKKSVVFTYRDKVNHPKAGTRSSFLPDISC